MQLAKTLRSAFRRDRTAALAKRSRQRLALEALEQRLALTGITINLSDLTGLDPSVGKAWVAGYINGSKPSTILWLQSTGIFVPTGGSSGEFFPVHGFPQITLDTKTDGNDRFVFVVSPTKPSDYNNVIQWVQGPDGHPQAPGPFDILEFGYEAAFNTSQVDAMGLNLSFTGTDEEYLDLTHGFRPDGSRAEVQVAWNLFMEQDHWRATFKDLLYKSATASQVVANQFTSILAPKTYLFSPTYGGWNPVGSPTPTWTALNTFYDSTVEAFFKNGNQLSIQMPNGDTPFLYTGTSDGNRYMLTATNGGPNGGTLDKSFFSTIGAGSQPFSTTSANVFVQYIPVNTPFAQLQDAVLQAFERGVALDGVYTGTGTAPDGFSSTAWTDSTKWYKETNTGPNDGPSRYDAYAKFLHTSTKSGQDFREVGGLPLMGLNRAGTLAMAYGFSEDENPNVGATTWPLAQQVPSKTPNNVSAGATVTITVGPWGDASASSLAVVAGDFDGNGLTDIADLRATGQWQVALTPTTGSPTTVNAASPWATAGIQWEDFTVIRDGDRDVVLARAFQLATPGVGSWWKLSYDGTTWSTTFVGSWGIPDQWVDTVSGDFDGDGKQDIAGRWQEKGQWWMLSDAAAPATDATYAAKNVQIGQWNPAASWTEVVAGNFTGDADGKDTIAGLTGPSWWLLERTGASSTNTLMTSAWSTAHAWSNFQVGNFTGALNGQEQIAARSSLNGGWHLLGKNGDSYAVSSMAAWNPAATWLNVVAGDFAGEGTTGIAGRNAATGAWTVLRKTSGTSASPTFTNANFEGAWPTSPQWAQAFAGIYTQQADSPKKFGILGRSVGNTPNTWEKAISSGTAFTSSAAPGYPA